MTTNCLEVLLEAAVFMSTQAGRSGSEKQFRCPKSPASPEFQSLRSLERNGRSEARVPFDTCCAVESRPEEAFPSRFGQKSGNILLGLGFDQAQLAVRSLVDDVDALGRRVAKDHYAAARGVQGLHGLMNRHGLDGDSLHGEDPAFARTFNRMAAAGLGRRLRVRRLSSSRTAWRSNLSSAPLIAVRASPVSSIPTKVWSRIAKASSAMRRCFSAVKITCNPNPSPSKRTSLRRRSSVYCRKSGVISICRPV